MIEKLLYFQRNSYSPYSNYQVSAVVVMKDGTEFYGVNVETSSPAAGICAERNALYNAITNGIRKEDIKEIHVASKNGVTPCFICRQALVDYCNMDTKVYIYSMNNDTKELLVSDLCTHVFGKGDLE